MKYQGSKSRYVGDILPFLLHCRESPNQPYVEPFVGGANMIENITGVRIAGDAQTYLIEMFIAAQNGWLPPKIVTESLYKRVQQNKDSYHPALIGYIGFAMSFGGKFFGGYRRDKKGQQGDIKNMIMQSKRSYQAFIKQMPKLAGVTFYNLPYDKLPIPPYAIIYNDPPYAKTTKYKTGDFDHPRFWQWCRDKVTEGYLVLTSEYTAPSDFVSVWSKTVSASLTQDRGSKKATEHLWVHKDQLYNFNKM